MMITFNLNTKAKASGRGQKNIFLISLPILDSLGIEGEMGAPPICTL